MSKTYNGSKAVVTIGGVQIENIVTPSFGKSQRVHKLVKLTPISTFAKQCVKDYGSVLRLYQESDNVRWFTCPTEEDPYNFKHWSFSLEVHEGTVEEIK